MSSESAESDGVSEDTASEAETEVSEQSDEQEGSALDEESEDASSANEQSDIDVTAPEDEMDIDPVSHDESVRGTSSASREAQSAVDEVPDSEEEIQQQAVPASELDGDSVLEAPREEAADTPPSKQSDSTQGTASPRKRKRALSGTQRGTKRQKKPAYHDAYRVRLNDNIQDAVFPHTDPSFRPVPLDSSQLGLVIWSTAEKDLFFTALRRYGRDAVDRIAEAVRSKSPVEVRDYLLLLQDGLEEVVLFEERNRLLSYAEIPAAIEVSAECDKALEKEAQKLAGVVREAEEEQQKAKCGEKFWRVDVGLARTLDLALKWERSNNHAGGSDEGETASDDENDEAANPVAAPSTPGTEGPQDSDSLKDIPKHYAAALSAIPSARLLNATRFLELSHRIFMNSSNPLDNWRAISPKPAIAAVPEAPSIQTTAFSDFENLAVSLTRRLLQASIFQAMTRWRSSTHNNTRHTTRRLLKKRDVHAACEIMGLKKDAKLWWAEAPRRCGLRVVKTLEETYIGKSGEDVEEARVREVDLQEAENELRLDELRAREGLPPLRRPASYQTQRAADNDSAQASEESDSGSEYRDSTHPSPNSPDSSRSTTASDLVSDAEAYTSEHEDEAYAEYVDMIASREEEQRLWNMLEKPDPHADAPPLKAVRKPKNRRKRAEYLDDWRKVTEYRAFWETVSVDAGKKEADGVVSKGKGRMDEELVIDEQSEDDDDGDSVEDIEVDRIAQRESAAASQEAIPIEDPGENPGESESESEGKLPESSAAAATRQSLPRKARESSPVLLEEHPEYASSDDNYEPE